MHGTTLLATAMVTTPQAECGSSLGDSRLVISIPETPGYPEGVATFGSAAFVSGPAAFGNAGGGPSRIWTVSIPDRAILSEYEIQGQDINMDHGLAGVAFDKAGRLYVIDTQRGVVRLTVLESDIYEEVYATPFPDLLPCAGTATGIPCSPTPIDLPPLPNDIAFAPDGSAYVTDSLQATIYRIPPGDSEPQIWFQDPALFAEFGPNGIRMSPDRNKVFFAMTGPSGAIYALPLQAASPNSCDLELFHAYGQEGPDGIAFGNSGNLYVTLAYSNQISVLLPDGTEKARFSGPIQTGEGSLPYDAPAVIAFDDRCRSLVVTNHALVSGNAARFAAFTVFVDDSGSPLEYPILP